MGQSRSQLFENKWKLSADELSTLVDDNPSLRSFVMGYAAELKLRQTYFESERVTDAAKADDHDRSNKGDLTFMYKNKRVVVEVKSLQTNSCRWDPVEKQVQVEYQCDASDRRQIRFTDGTTHETTNLLAGEFDMIAVNLFPLLGEWKFLFAPQAALSRVDRGNYRAPGRSHDGASLTDSHKTQLLKTTQRIVFSKGWKHNSAYSADPWKTLDQIITGKNDPLNAHVEPTQSVTRDPTVNPAFVRSQASIKCAREEFGPWAE